LQSVRVNIDRERLKTDSDYRAELRRWAQTDMLFLAGVLGYTKFIERVHRPVADLCVLKDPDKDIEEQEGIKERVHLDPRGTYKSASSIVDSVQWIICFPNIRICKLTATKPLAKAIANEIRDHFVKGAIEEPTLFQDMFPEFVISERDKKEGEFKAPNRTKKWKEETVMAFSIETTISGWHFDVMDPDDIVDTQNSSTAPGIAKVKKNWRINRKTLMPWGFINYKGTRYNPNDLWGDIIEKARPGKIKMLIRGAVKRKDGRRIEPGDFPAENELEILFPELLSYDFLKTQFDDDYESFMSQYMNDAQGGNEVTFTHEAMFAATVPHDALPITGETFIAWRFAYASKPMMKKAGGAVGIMDNGRLYIVDCISGTFKPSALAHKIVLTAKKYGTHTVTIENTPGAMRHESAIKNYALTLGWPITVNWVDFEEDDGVRDQRVKSVEPLIVSTRLVFADSIPALNQVYKQFCNYGMVEECELPDVVSRLSDRLPKSISVAELEQQQDLDWELARQRDMYDRTHGLGNYAPKEPVVEEVYKPPTNGLGLSDDLGGLNG
jgi:hypothetical protein